MNAENLNVLFIGNSFSECTCAYLYDLLTALGITSFNISALKISGCTLNMHWANAQTDAPAYLFFRYNVSGDRETVSSSYTLREGITSNQWDWVIFADGSAALGAPDSLVNFHALVDYVKALTTPGRTKFAFNMTWPWEAGYSKFADYYGDPDTMFRTITDRIQKEVLAHPDITCVLPNGTAIRNAVRSGRAPALYRDGSHINANGCFIASLTTAYTLLNRTDGFSGYDIGRCGLPCLPADPHRTNGSFIGSLDPEYADIFLEAASAALADPFGAETV